MCFRIKKDGYFTLHCAYVGRTLAIFPLLLEKKHVRVDSSLLNVLFQPLGEHNIDEEIAFIVTALHVNTS